MTNKVRLGGSFAPPINSEQVARYRELAKAAEDPRVRDAVLPLCEMVEIFQKTPDSRLNGQPHPVGEFTDGSGQKRQAPAVVPLEESEIKRIWDYVPWDYECDALAVLFEEIEQDVAFRNSQKISEWKRTVANVIISGFFPDRSKFEKVQQALKNVADWLFLLEENQAAKIQEQYNSVNECNAAITKAFASKQYEGLPYPKLEPTPLRDAAHHLLWFARELTRDREPLTNDKLG